MVRRPSEYESVHSSSTNRYKGNTLLLLLFNRYCATPRTKLFGSEFAAGGQVCAAAFAATWVSRAPQMFFRRRRLKKLAGWRKKLAGVGPTNTLKGIYRVWTETGSSPAGKRPSLSVLSQIVSFEFGQFPHHPRVDG